MGSRRDEHVVGLEVAVADRKGVDVGHPAEHLVCVQFDLEGSETGLLDELVEI